MKWYYLFLLMVFFLMSCKRTGPTINCKDRGVDNYGNRIYELTIDEHDYIKMEYKMAHSGTCKKCKQERDSIVNVIINEIRNGKSKRKTVYEDLKKFCYIAKDNDYIEVTEWTNGEGWDINFNDKRISLTYGELNAINYLIKVLDYEFKE